MLTSHFKPGQIIRCRSTGVSYTLSKTTTVRKTKIFEFTATKDDKANKYTRDFKTTQEALEKAIRTKVLDVVGT